MVEMEPWFVFNWHNQAYRLWAIPSDISVIPGSKKQNKNNNQIRQWIIKYKTKQTTPEM